MNDCKHVWGFPTDHEDVGQSCYRCVKCGLLKAVPIGESPGQLELVGMAVKVGDELRPVIRSMV